MRIKTAIKRALTRVAERIRDRARGEAPYRTGDLKKSIHVGEVTDAGDGFSVAVGTNLSYAKYVHEGTGQYGPLKRPYTIQPKNKRALYWPGARHPVKKVTQKGIRPNRFLLRAARAAGQDVDVVAGEMIAEGIRQDIRESLRDITVKLEI